MYLPLAGGAEPGQGVLSVHWGGQGLRTGQWLPVASRSTHHSLAGLARGFPQAPQKPVTCVRQCFVLAVWTGGLCTSLSSPGPKTGSSRGTSPFKACVFPVPTGPHSD